MDFFIKKGIDSLPIDYNDPKYARIKNKSSRKRMIDFHVKKNLSFQYLIQVQSEMELLHFPNTPDNPKDVTDELITEFEKFQLRFFPCELCGLPGVICSCVFVDVEALPKVDALKGIDVEALPEIKTGDSAAAHIHISEAGAILEVEQPCQSKGNDNDAATDCVIRYECVEDPSEKVKAWLSKQDHDGLPSNIENPLPNDNDDNASVPSDEKPSGERFNIIRVVRNGAGELKKEILNTTSNRRLVQVEIFDLRPYTLHSPKKTHPCNRRSLNAMSFMNGTVAGRLKAARYYVESMKLPPNTKVYGKCSRYHFIPTKNKEHIKCNKCDFCTRDDISKIIATLCGRPKGPDLWDSSHCHQV